MNCPYGKTYGCRDFHSSPYAQDDGFQATIGGVVMGVNS